jgi:hypothetical protein
MIEKKLREAPLVAPSSALDNKIQELIDNSLLSQRRLFRRPVPLWASVAACVFFSLLGFFVNQWIRPDRQQFESGQVLIYIMEPNEELRNLLIREQRKADQSFFQMKKSDIHIVTPKNISIESQSF